MDTITQNIVKSVQGQKQRVATFIGKKDSQGFVRIGWSRANVNSGDKFDPTVGLNIATSRLSEFKIIPVPPSLEWDVNRFKDRCKKYFKDAINFPEVIIQEITPETTPETTP